MTQFSDQLFSEFAISLNEELATLESGLRVSTSAPSETGWMDLVGATGARLGQVPDDVSAKAIRAFEDIIDRERGQPVPR